MKKIITILLVLTMMVGLITINTVAVEAAPSPEDVVAAIGFHGRSRDSANENFVDYFKIKRGDLRSTYTTLTWTLSNADLKKVRAANPTKSAMEFRFYFANVCDVAVKHMGSKVYDKNDVFVEKYQRDWGNMDATFINRVMWLNRYNKPEEPQTSEGNTNYKNAWKNDVVKNRNNEYIDFLVYSGDTNGFALWNDPPDAAPSGQEEVPGATERAAIWGMENGNNGGTALLADLDNGEGYYMEFTITIRLGGEPTPFELADEEDLGAYIKSNSSVFDKNEAEFLMDYQDLTFLDRVEEGYDEDAIYSTRARVYFVAFESAEFGMGALPNKVKLGLPIWEDANKAAEFTFWNLEYLEEDYEGLVLSLLGLMEMFDEDYGFEDIDGDYAVLIQDDQDGVVFEKMFFELLFNVNMLEYETDDVNAIYIVFETTVRYEAKVPVTTGEITDEDEDVIIYFDIDGERTPIPAKIGDKLQKPVDPEAEAGYEFDGWYYGDHKWDFENDVVEEGMTLEARFSPIQQDNTDTRDAGIAFAAVVSVASAFGGFKIRRKRK